MKRNYKRKRKGPTKKRRRKSTEKRKYYQRGYRARTRKSNTWKTILLVLGCVALIALFAIAILGFASSKDTTSTQIKQNTKDIGSLKLDVAELSDKFDDFIYQNLELMFEMRQAIDQVGRDESVHVTLTNVGVADTQTDTSSASQADQDVTVSDNEGKDMPHS